MADVVSAAHKVGSVRPRSRVRPAGEQTNVLNTRNRRASKRRLITRLGAIARSAGSNSRRYTDP